MPPVDDPDETFVQAVDRVRRGELRFRIEAEDHNGDAFLVEAEPWGAGCLTYATVQALSLASDSERLGASVFRFICGHAECQWRHVRTEWVRDSSIAVSPTEYGVSVMLFYRDDPPVSPM